MQGVVFNAHYLVWADEAVNTWWEQQGVDWPALTARGIDYYVVASALEWRGSARWGDTVTVGAELEKLGRSSLTVRFEIAAGERLCCVVRTTYVCATDGASVPWPDEVRERVSAG
jgi:acyl-CoA thioester hydrolase